MKQLLEAKQNFYKAMEMAVVDNFPQNKSHYQTLMLEIDGAKSPLWEVIENHLASFIANWPEWSQILKNEEESINLDEIKEIHIPEKFKYFDQRIQETMLNIEKYLCDIIKESIFFSIKRFEEHPPYKEACHLLRTFIKVDNFDTYPEALPILDAWNPSRVADHVASVVIEKIQSDLTMMKNVRFPYNSEKDCYWNLALIIRLQIQILKTLREKIFDVIATAEIQFQDFFTNEVLKGEILPLIRNNLNNQQFMNGVFAKEV